MENAIPFGTMSELVDCIQHVGSDVVVVAVAVVVVRGGGGTSREGSTNEWAQVAQHQEHRGFGIVAPADVDALGGPDAWGGSDALVIIAGLDAVDLLLLVNDLVSVLFFRLFRVKEA